jgi:hypothetical protein
LIKVTNAARKSVTMHGISAKPDGCSLLATSQGLIADDLVNVENFDWFAIIERAIVQQMRRQVG